jgi:hypothetical protein
VHPALRTVGDEVRDTLVRLLAYIGAVALLAVAAAWYFELPKVTAASEPEPRSDWTLVERPYRAFTINVHGLPEPHYAIHRHRAGGRKDIMTIAVEEDAPLRLMVEIYRPGEEIPTFGTSAEEVAARTLQLGGPYDLKSTDAIASKFGRLNAFEFAAEAADGARNCLGFVRAIDDPRLQISGWYCNSGPEVVERRTVFCVIEGLSLLAAASDPATQRLFATAEQRRTFCSPRTALRGTALYRLDWIEGANQPKLRRTVAAR